ncbi:MAG: ribonuclease H-like domain-containing protein, partial [Desulfosalsimonas sp.]
KGGLKGCEKQMGIDRKELDGIDGYLAVLLWHEYEETGSLSALETLMAYNAQDTVNLEYLMHTAYNLKVNQTPFAKTMALARPDRPRIPFAAHSGLVQRIMEKSTAHGINSWRRVDGSGA